MSASKRPDSASADFRRKTAAAEHKGRRVDSGASCGSREVLHHFPEFGQRDLVVLQLVVPDARAARSGEHDVDNALVANQKLSEQLAAQKKLVTALTKVGFAAKMPNGTYFLYAKAPKSGGGRTFASAEEVTQFLIEEQSVCCVPWDDAGAFLRFSVTYEAADEQKEDALMAETEARLRQIQPEFS